MEQAFLGYYQKLFTSAVPSNIGEATVAIKGSISATMNLQLLVEFTVEDVQISLS
jgi:hypothetical protein